MSSAPALDDERTAAVTLRSDSSGPAAKRVDEGAEFEAAGSRNFDHPDIDGTNSSFFLTQGKNQCQSTLEQPEKRAEEDSDNGNGAVGEGHKLFLSVWKNVAA
ncbi:hypothetical protein BH11CYA1_BH11CYA1_38530 [soil metagenome]